MSAILTMSMTMSAQTAIVYAENSNNGGDCLKTR